MLTATGEVYLQPHEGIVGVDRTDVWLSLDESSLATRGLLVATAHALRTAVFVGSPAPIVERMRDRLTNPRPGDVVCELSAIWKRRPVEAQYMMAGYLVEKRREWAFTDDEWDECRDQYEPYGQARPTDTVWYVQYGPSAVDVCRWENCSFITLPSDEERWYT